jgi:ribose/xylose/arabinose/galactoside ABC-type transport system permease subunit
MKKNKDNGLSKENHRLLKSIINKKEFGIFVPLVVIFVISGLINPLFFGAQNLTNILFQSSFIFIIGVAMTFVLISAGLDLSVGSVLALGGVVAGLALLAGLPIWLSIIIGLLIGVAVGIFNGYFISTFSMPTLIVTLSMMYIARGIVEYLTRGNPVYPLPQAFNDIGQGRIAVTDGFGLPWPVVIAVVVGIIGHIILTRTTFGRAVFAIGGNLETARLSGINVKKVTMIIYIFSAVMASLSGIITAARLGSALSNAGTGMELNVIAAVIIGGTSMFGGVGSILGTAIGALIMTTVTNAMAMLKISVFLQKVIIGSIILLAVGIDQYNRKRSGV